MTSLPELSRRVSEAGGPNPEIDVAIATACSAWVHVAGRWPSCPPFTASLDAVAALIAEKLPGWMWRAQVCELSAEAWVAPDLNNRACPDDIRADAARWHDYAERNEVEIRPGSNATLVLALLSAALLAIHERKE